MSETKLPTDQTIPELDPDFLPTNPHNQAVAEELGLEYNPASKSYEDDESGLVRDEFGQPY